MEILMIKYLLKDKNIYIISFYFSSEKVYNPKQLYYTKPYGDEGLEVLYNLASEIHPYSPIFDMLEERGWKIDYTKKITRRHTRIFSQRRPSLL